MRPDSSIKTIWGLRFTSISVFGALDQSGENWSQSNVFFKIFKFLYLNCWGYKFDFHNGIYELFWSCSPGDITKQLLKNQFWKLINQRFCPHFLQFHQWGLLLIKDPIFLFLNWHILRTANAGEINELILKSSHYGLPQERYYCQVLNFKLKKWLDMANDGRQIQEPFDARA